jgi:hypothetical protein
MVEEREMGGRGEAKAAELQMDYRGVFTERHRGVFRGDTVTESPTPSD